MIVSGFVVGRTNLHLLKVWLMYALEAVVISAAESSSIIIKQSSTYRSGRTSIKTYLLFGTFISSYIRLLDEREAAFCFPIKQS